MDIEISSLVLLGFCGIFVGIFGAVIGAAQFFAFPLFQMLFPFLSFGQIVGNAKMGGFARGLATTVTTRKEIDWKENILFSLPLVIGTIVGASFIAQLDQRWIFPALLFAILFSEYSVRLSFLLRPQHFWGASLLLGVYAGFLGAGIGVMIVALLRLRFPRDEDIAHAKIQARFIEWILVFFALGAHILHGNILWAIALSWGIGAFFGGIIGGILLKKMGRLSGKIQKRILRFAFLFALIVAGSKFFAIL